MTDEMKQYEQETGNEYTSQLYAQEKLWKYIHWLEDKVRVLTGEIEQLRDIALQNGYSAVMRIE